MKQATVLITRPIKKGDPTEYTEVWETYQEEVLGKPHSSSGSMCVYKHVPALVSLVHPSSQCQ